MPARDYFGDLVGAETSVTGSGTGGGPGEDYSKTVMSSVEPVEPVMGKGTAVAPAAAHPGEPQAPCPACGYARWWQNRAGWWWCERCHPFQTGQWARLLELPEGKRPDPAPVKDEEVEAAVAVAERYGWSRDAFREFCGGDWSGLPEPERLEVMLRAVAPHPSLQGDV